MKAREEEGMGEYDQGVLKEGRGNDVFRNETSARIEKGWREGEGVEQLACRVRHNNERGESARKKLRNEGIEADERVTVGSKTLITRVNYPLIV